MLARAALPLGLLAVGAALHLRVAFSRTALLGLSAALKLLAMPALAYGLGYTFGLHGLELVVPMLFAALPTAPSAYILARLLGGDAELMAAVITAQTVLSMFTLPLVLLLLGP